MSVDPYMRGRMNDRKSYVPPFEIGKVLEGGAVGEVIESRAKEFKPGDAVVSNFGWREYFIASPKDLHPVSRAVQPLSLRARTFVSRSIPCRSYRGLSESWARRRLCAFESCARRNYPSQPRVAFPVEQLGPLCSGLPVSWVNGQ